MGKRTSYPPGTFSYAELATSDAAAAKDFYTRLFAWEYDDVPVGDGRVYSIANRDGSAVGGLYATGDQPPHWNCYVTVTSVDGTVEAAAGHGGSVVVQPHDVQDLGRTAIVADPAGARLCLWEPRRRIGAYLVNAPGAMNWNDLVTPDPEAAARFYGVLFGWRAQEIPSAGGYRVIWNGERTNGGIMPVDVERMGPDAPPAWIPYFGHDDVGRLIAEIDGLGGRLFNGPIEMLQGSIAILGDPQGAVFAVWTGDYDD